MLLVTQVGIIATWIQLRVRKGIEDRLKLRREILEDWPMSATSGFLYVSLTDKNSVSAIT